MKRLAALALLAAGAAWFLAASLRWWARPFYKGRMWPMPERGA